MDLKDVFQMIREVFRTIVLLPFYPLAIGIAFFFGWVMSAASKIPEDLDEQVKLANKKANWDYE